jgi:hypothetical protein
MQARSTYIWCRKRAMRASCIAWIAQKCGCVRTVYERQNDVYRDVWWSVSQLQSCVLSVFLLCLFRRPCRHVSLMFDRLLGLCLLPVRLAFTFDRFSGASALGIFVYARKRRHSTPHTPKTMAPAAIQLPARCQLRARRRRRPPHRDGVPFCKTAPLCRAALLLRLLPHVLVLAFLEVGAPARARV